MTRLRPVSAQGHARIGLVQFPGSNCDADMMDAVQRHFDVKVQAVWHTEAALPPLDAVILPGGFSYGDYLRSGALAAHSPIMAAVKNFAKQGGAVLGVCNGFQVLVEARLLPGALLRNQSRQFICQQVSLIGVKGESTYQRTLAGKRLTMPIAHGEGRYYVDADGLKRLVDEQQVAFRYVDDHGRSTPAANPNGSLDGIAGIVSANGRVLGMMPHPERATDVIIGGTADGKAILEAFLASFL